MKRIALFEIINLFLAILAFSFLISLASENVSGETAWWVDASGKLQGGESVPSDSIPNNQKYWPTFSQALANAPKVQSPVGQAPPPSNLAPTAGLGTGAATQFAGGTVSLPGQMSIPLADGTKAAVSQIVKTPNGYNLIGPDGKEVLTGLNDAQMKGLGKDFDPANLKFGQQALTPTTSGPSSMLSKLFGITQGGGVFDALATGLQWGLVAAGIGYMAGTLFGMDKQNTKALALALGGGALVWQTFQTLTPANAGALKIFTTQGFLGASTPLIIGIGVAAAIFIFMYKKTSSEQVKFECKPYEPPTGGNYCELCNKDKFRPCSEYRCKSLGQACQLLNAGTGKEACAWVNPNDVTSPIISPWTDALLKGHSYKDVRTRPPGTGMKVVLNSASDGCVKAFTPLSFGINTNEPTQCKIDYNHTVNVRDVKNAYDSMAFYFGETNIYSYNHSQTMRLPGPAALAAQNISPEISLDGTYTLYVRCQDANGNVNEDEFAIRFCVEKGPDTTPPQIEGTSIPSGMPVSFNTNDTELEVYVNEPADCKWSKLDQDYDAMENQMVCDQNVWDINTNMLYKCITKLTGLENRKDNQFYFRCKDQPYAENPNDRNSNSESYPFIIKGSQPLNIKANSIKPNGTIQGFANVVSVDLTLETENGYNGKGDSICYYSSSTVDSSFIKMFETGTNKHKQNQQLQAGQYVYYFKCVDLGGNADYNSTRFTIEIDRSAPAIVRIYNEGNNLKVETDEKSTCYYTENSNQKCNFQLSEGKQLLYANATAHYMEWKTNNNLYIKCSDTSGNQPNPTDCSIIVRAYNSK